MTTVVWFKRDLRTRDHAPLVAAASLGEPVIPLYVIEDEYWHWLLYTYPSPRD